MLLIEATLNLSMKMTMMMMMIMTSTRRTVFAEATPPRDLGLFPPPQRVRRLKMPVKSWTVFLQRSLRCRRSLQRWQAASEAEIQFARSHVDLPTSRSRRV